MPAEHICRYEARIEKIDEKQDRIAEDIAVIKNYLIGNGREGLLKVVDRHEKKFNEQAGSLMVVHFILVMILIPIGILVFRQFYIH